MTEAESNRRLAEALWKYLKPKIGKLASGQSDEIGGDSGKRIYQTREHYYLSLSSTELIGGAWQDTVPIRPAGTYIWQRWVIYYVDGTRDELNPVCVTGDPGDPGTSVRVVSVKYQAGTSDTSPPTGEWSSDLVEVHAGEYLWTRMEFSDGTTAYSLARQGIDGIDGVDGIPGESSYIHIKYSDYAEPTDGQISEAPKAYIGICVNSEVDDPTTASSYTWSRFAGVDGADGVQGPAGADGISTYVHFAYAISSGGEEGFSTTPFEGAKYLGVLTDNVEADSEDPSKYKWSLMRGADGIDGTDGVDGTSVSVEAIQYQQGDSATTPPADESGWSAQPVAVEQGYYLWTRTKFSDGSYAYCVSRQAQDGDHGVSVVNQTMEYYLSMETGELLPAPESETWTGDWQSAVPTIVEDTYMWYRVRTYYSNGGSTVTDPVCMSSVMNEVVAPSYGELGSLIASAQRNMEVLEETLRAELVSQSVMGDFRSEMETKFSQSAEGLELQMQAYSQLKGNLDLLSEAFENYTAAMAGSIKVGVVYYENALPVMGVAVGQNLSTTVDEDGVVHIDQVNFRAIYAAKEMSFWQGDKKVAYISGQKLFINEANILAGATIGDWEITTSNGLAFKYVGG